MKSEIWKRVEDFFDEVADLQAEERIERLEAVRNTDPEIYAELTSLIEAHDEADELLGGLENLVSEPDFEPMPDPISRLTAALEGRYRIKSELGEGGMATVYLADDLKHGRKVALKVLKPQLAAVVGAERFLAEIKTTANLQHPHILPLHDSGDADGFLFYVTPYVEGETLREKLDREHQLPADEALKLTTDIAEALGVAHKQGIVHRDIKPANILLSSGRPLVADFGIALAVSSAGGHRLTETGLSIGTPHYMSPEQAAGEGHIDGRSDIYSLAAMMYEMLAGEPPYTGRTAQVILTKRRADPVPSVRRIRDKVPASVDATIQRGLAPVSADRFATMAEFTSALTTLVVDEAGEPTLWKRWAAAGVAAALMAALGVGLTTGKLGRGWAVDESLRAIAVLPFENFSPDAEQAYIAKGLTAEISSQLLGIEALRVISSRAAERLVAAGRTLQEIGEALNVGTVLEGSVSQAGEELRISAQLTDVGTNEVLWSGDFDGTVADVFDMRRTVALAIAAALDATLSPDEARRLDTPPTENMEAYEFYQQAATAVQGQNADAERETIALLYQAIALDSTFAEAIGLLGWMYGDLFVRSREPHLADSAEVFARRAIALDSKLVRGHHALARIFRYRGRLSEARLTFLAGQAVTGELGGLALDLSALSIQLGNLDESLLWAERVLVDRPLPAADVYFNVARSLLWLGDDERTEQFLDESLGKFPNFNRLHTLYADLDLSRGRFDDAMRRYRRLVNDYPSNTGLLGDLAVAASLTGADDALELWGRLLDGDPPDEGPPQYAVLLVQAGQEERGRQMLESGWRDRYQAYEDGTENPWVAAGLGVISAARGETEEVFVWLERAYRAGFRDPVPLRLDPVFESVREDERFVELVARIEADIEEMRRRAFNREGALFRNSVSVR